MIAASLWNYRLVEFGHAHKLFTKSTFAKQNCYFEICLKALNSGFTVVFLNCEISDVWISPAIY